MALPSLTIQDYLLKAGLRPVNQSSAPPVTEDQASPFNRMLAEVQSTPTPASPPSGGLSISDYLANPVIARNHSKRTGVAAPEAEEPEAHSEPALALTTDRGSKPDHNRTSAIPPDPLKPPQGSVLKAGRQNRMNEAQTIETSIQQAAQKYDLAPEMLRAIIQAESSFRVRAVSPAGAQGLMQLMPETARELGVSDPFDIAQNIDGGARYFRQMLDLFDNDVKLALAAYNAGPGTVRRFNGEVPYRETQNYIARVLTQLAEV